MNRNKHSIFIILLFCGVIVPGWTYEFSWEIAETPAGAEQATVVAPIHVVLLGEAVAVPSHSASLTLMRKYSVHLGPEWRADQAYRLLQTFESIPQVTNGFYHRDSLLPASLWRLSSRHIQDDISLSYAGEDGTLVTVSEAAFVHATPLLAAIDGVRGRYFSKRLHRAVVRFVTANGTDTRALERILEHRYGVRLSVPDYAELTRYTTQEHAGHFQEFKAEELIAIAAMLEEYPTGMHKTPGLKYLVRRLDGLPHPQGNAPAVAWTGAGYIEFMESAFHGTDIIFLHRLVLHEKAHFLWDHLFDAQLKQDWITVGGWSENPADKDGWSTTKQVEFVSAYAHAVNPNEDMAESISYYIVTPDKLRSRSPAKYTFIQNRVMHGTRYISQIREDLTFKVYNLWPDYVYPGRIIGIDIQVTGDPEEDKQVTVELRLHGESDLDTATRGYTRIFSEKAGITADIHFYPVDADGQHVHASHTLRSYPVTISRYAPNGYWIPDTIQIGDANLSERYTAQTDFGWKLYMDNPLADCEPPAYVPNSLRLSLSESKTDSGERYQIITARWQVIEDNAVKSCGFSMNDEHPETYSLRGGSGYFRSPYVPEREKILTRLGEVGASVIIPDYKQSGTHTVVSIGMEDVAGNRSGVWFVRPGWGLGENETLTDEVPPTITVQTRFPDAEPPELDVNAISIKAESTNPSAPNGETRVDITFRVRDNIAGYGSSRIHLRDPQGVRHGFTHYGDDHNQKNDNMYFTGDPTVYQTYQKTVILPVGSPPGTWGLSDMTLYDKAENTRRVDFTEIIRFELVDETLFDLNADAVVNILDLVIVANAMGESESPSEVSHHDDRDRTTSHADVNRDGEVNILDVVLVASHFQ